MPARPGSAPQPLSGAAGAALRRGRRRRGGPVPSSGALGAARAGLRAACPGRAAGEAARILLPAPAGRAAGEAGVKQYKRSFSVLCVGRMGLKSLNGLTI